MQYWLMKSEPGEFSINDLEKIGEEPWSGVRSYQARKYMREEMQIGDRVLFYHSSCEVPGVYGLARVSHLAEPDQAQFDTKSKYFEPRAKRAAPIWYGVRVRFVKKLKRPVTLAAMRADTRLKGLFIFKNGRLSVGPVGEREYRRIVKMAGE
ncbi:MAG TPA: EVE domain-containing protein [Candidatus Paceibacterota bacterium]|nr:EVE domain-containing protein [Candidatus Paceibacterota bacterium]